MKIISKETDLRKVLAAELSEEELEDGVKEADLYLKYGLEDKAKDKLIELAEVAPDNLGIRRKLREICFRRGDMEGWAGEQLKIADIHRREGQLHEAMTIYAAILEEEPENALAKEAISSLSPEKETPKEPPLERALPEESVPKDLELLEAEPGGAEDLLDNGLGELEYDLASGIAGFDGVEASELGDIVKEFKAGVSEKLDLEDYETHYDLGVAYKEMGLLEEALSEFQVSANSPLKARDSYTSMAMIYQSSGQLQEAHTALNRALSSVVDAEGEERAAVLYELGLLCEEMGEPAKARGYYRQTAEINPAMRDVAGRLEAIAAQLGG